MRAAIAAALVVGCGGRVAPEALPAMPHHDRPAEPAPPPVSVDPPGAPIDWNRARWDDDAAVRDLWARLRIDRDHWRERLDAIPRRPELRAALASLLLRDGNIGCPVVEVKHGCQSVPTLERPPADAGIDDACVRRELAMWAVEQLPAEVLATELWDATIALFRLPAPERELNQRALARISGNAWMVENALWEAMSAGNRGFVEANLALLNDAQRYQAATAYDIDAALLELDVAAYPDAFVAALTSSQLRADTRVEAAHRLVALVPTLDADSAHRQRLTAELARAARQDHTSCAVAGVAISLQPTAVAELTRRRATTEQELLHQVCVAAFATGGRGPAWKRLITRHDLTVTRHFHDDRLVVDSDADGDGNPATWEQTEQRYYHRWFRLPFADELAAALPGCVGTDCALPGAPVEFRFDIRPERGGRLRIFGIHRYERVGDDCAVR